MIDTLLCPYPCGGMLDYNRGPEIKKLSENVHAPKSVRDAQVAQSPQSPSHYGQSVCPAGKTVSFLHFDRTQAFSRCYIQGNHQQYMAERFSLSVASLISLWACPSHDRGSEGWLSTPTRVPLRRPSMVARASLAASLAGGGMSGIS